MKRAALIAVFLACDVAAQKGSLTAERLYHDSLYAYTKGDYQKALEGFMDVLLADPVYPGARDRLSSTAQRLRAIEEAKIEQERKRLMSEIERAHGIKSGPPVLQRSYFEDGPGVLSNWRRLIKETLAAAKDERGLPRTLQRYEKALKIFPIRHDNGHEFLEARTLLQQKLLAAFPHMDGDPAWKNRKAGRFNTGDFAAAIFAEKHYSDRWKNSSQGLFFFAQKDPGDSNAELAARVAELEKQLGQESKLAYGAYLKFSAGKYRESAALWQELLALDPGNPEAESHLERASKELAVEEKPAPKTPKPAPREKPKEARPLPEALPPVKDELEPKEGKEALAQEYYLKGLRDYSLGKLDDAVLHWKACLELNEDHPKARKALSRALAEQAP